MLEGGIRDGNRLFEVNRCATISPREPASVNRPRQFSSESFPPRKWQILAFLVVFLSWRSPPTPCPTLSCSEISSTISRKANLHPPTVNRQLPPSLCTQAGGPWGAVDHAAAAAAGAAAPGAQHKGSQHRAEGG